MTKNKPKNKNISYLQLNHQRQCKAITINYVVHIFFYCDSKTTFFLCLTLVVFAFVVSHLIYILPVWVLNYIGFIPGRTILLFQWDKTGQSSSIVKLGKIFVIASRIWDSCVTCKQKIGSIVKCLVVFFSGRKQLWTCHIQCIW